ncbi:MAG: glycosyltransferase family 4 protein [Bacteroidales bacterium]|nr:glycosyltransferase family 4 protein [Bacteroidales bacterium]
MRIAINTRLLLPGRLDGIGWFTYETTRRMVLSHPEVDFFLFFDRKPDAAFIFASNVHPVVLHPKTRHPILWYLFFEWSVKRALKRYKIDLFLSPDGWMSLQTKVPTLDVIHDLNFEHADDFLRPSHQKYMKYFFPRFAHKATRIATVSEFSKRDIASTYNISTDKIDVVYDGAHNEYVPCNDEERQTTREKYTNGSPYYIYISTISKRKNLTNTLLAFNQFKENDKEDYKLVVVGARVWWDGELKEAYDNMQYKRDVIFVGRVEATELSRLLGAAQALVYVSLFEGFGIPILEAFYAEVPVITSNCTSMPEVAGHAALLVDPTMVDDIAMAMQLIANDEQRAMQLVEEGRRQRQLFSWERTANLLWESIIKTATT